MSESTRNRGKLPDIEIQKQLKLASDPVVRNAGDPDIQPILSNQEYQQLRNDLDRRNKEAYEKLPDQDYRVFNAQSVTASTSETFASTYYEEAEMYLEAMPDLVLRLFQAFDSNILDTVQEFDAEYIDTTFNEMAHMFQTDSIGLDHRMLVLSQELQELHGYLKSMKESFNDSVRELRNISETFQYTTNEASPDEYFFTTINTLKNLSEDFELYWSSMSFTARKFGRLQTQKRVHKLLDVMIFYVRILQTRRDIKRIQYNKLKEDFDRAKQLLQDHNIVSFRPRPDMSIDSSLHQLRKRVTQSYENLSESIPEHLMGEPSCFSKVYDVVRRDFFWPWNREVTIKGFRQAISILLIIAGIGVYIYVFLLV